MFSNIGEIIKIMARVAFWVATILCIIIGIVSWVIEEKNIIMGLYPIIVGLLSSIFGSILLFGFGQLIVNTDIIAEQSGRQNEKHEKYIKNKKENEVKTKTATAKAQIKDNTVSEEEFIDFNCPHCKEMLSFKKKTMLENKTIECPFCEYTIDSFQ